MSSPDPTPVRPTTSSPRPGAILRRRVREDRLLQNEDRFRVLGRHRRQPVRPGGPDRGPAAHEVLESRNILRGHLPARTPPAPGEALREAVLNAVAHRDYSSPAPIQIRVYDDRIAMWNPGTLPPEWTLDKLMRTHASAPHNPGIANAFFRAGMVEAWGRGIGDIVRVCRASGTTEPRWELEPGGLRLEFMFTGTGAGPLSGNAVHETARERRGTPRKADDPAHETARANGGGQSRWP